MSASCWRIGQNSLSWDSYALSYQTKETKHSFYLTSPDASGLLYRASPSSALWGFLNGSRTYCISRDTSTIASLVCAVRDCVVYLAKETFRYVSSAGSALDWLALYGPTIIIFGPESAIFAFVFMSLYKAVTETLAKVEGLPSWRSLYPLSAAVAGVAIGALVWLPALYSVCPIVQCVRLLLERCGANMSKPQDVSESIKSRGIRGLLWGTYACIGAPLIEEYLFRSQLRDYFCLGEKEDDPGLWDKLKPRVKVFGRAEAASANRLTWERMKTVIKTSVIFGMAHWSPAQGWSNIPITLSCTLLGMILALLRECTGNLWASTTLHAVWNGVIVLRCYDVIPPIPWIE